MKITLPNTYVTAYPEMSPNGQFNPSAPNLNAGQSFPPGMANPLAASLNTRIDNYATPNYLDALKTFFQNPTWTIALAIELKALAAADQLCAEGEGLTNSLKMVVDSIVGCQQINEYIIRYPTGGRVFSGGYLSGLHAIQHAIDGKGENATFPINNIGLNVNLAKIPDVMNVIRNARPVGKSTVDVSFSYDVGNDSKASWLVLGHITLRVVGEVNKNSSGDWSFNGAIRAYNDTYDANPSTHRDWLGENLTLVLGKVMKQSYSIEIPGEIPVNMIGQ